MRLAQDLRRRAASQKGLTPQQRQNARRHAFNLVKINWIEARRRAKLAPAT